MKFITVPFNDEVEVPISSRIAKLHLPLAESSWLKQNKEQHNYLLYLVHMKIGAWINVNETKYWRANIIDTS